jgi:DNA-directed RNA polymerase subunit RPC12/RpoP
VKFQARGKDVSANFQRQVRMQPYFGAVAFVGGIVGICVLMLIAPFFEEALWPYYLYMALYIVVLWPLHSYFALKCPECRYRIPSYNEVAEIETCSQCGATLSPSNKSPNRTPGTSAGFKNGNGGTG